MFCFEKIYTFSVGEEDFKQRSWVQPPFLSHIRLRVLGAVFVAHFGWQLRIWESGFIFSFYSFVGGDEEVARSSFV